MSIRPHPTKQGHYQVIISNGRGKPQDVFVFRCTEPEARVIDAELKKTHRKNTPTNAVIPTFGQLVPDFIEYYKTVVLPNTVISWFKSWKALEPYVKDLKPNYLTPLVVQKYKQDRLTTVKKRTINKDLSALAAIVRYCEADESGPLIDPLPFKIKGFPAKQTRAPLPKVLTEQEVHALLANMKHAQGIAAAMYYAALRFHEAANLKRESVDTANRVLYIRGKGDKERVVPIADELLPYIDSGQSTGLLWPSRVTGESYRDIRGALTRAAERAGITKHVYPHLLRHTFGAHATADSVPLRATQAIMGHSTSQVTERYTQVAAQMLQDQMARLSDGRKKRIENS